jgi:hypothetical protein
LTAWFPQALRAEDRQSTLTAAFPFGAERRMGTPKFSGVYRGGEQMAAVNIRWKVLLGVFIPIID